MLLERSGWHADNGDIIHHVSNYCCSSTNHNRRPDMYALPDRSPYSNPAEVAQQYSSRKACTRTDMTTLSQSTVMVHVAPRIEYHGLPNDRTGVDRNTGKYDAASSNFCVAANVRARVNNSRNFCTGRL